MDMEPTENWTPGAVIAALAALLAFIGMLVIAMPEPEATLDQALVAAAESSPE